MSDGMWVFHEMQKQRGKENWGLQLSHMAFCAGGKEDKGQG